MPTNHALDWIFLFLAGRSSFGIALSCCPSGNWLIRNRIVGIGTHTYNRITKHQKKPYSPSVCVVQERGLEPLFDCCFNSPDISGQHLPIYILMDVYQFRHSCVPHTMYRLRGSCVFPLLSANPSLACPVTHGRLHLGPAFPECQHGVFSEPSALNHFFTVFLTLSTPWFLAMGIVGFFEKELPLRDGVPPHGYVLF